MNERKKKFEIKRKELKKATEWLVCIVRTVEKKTGRNVLYVKRVICEVLMKRE